MVIADWTVDKSQSMVFLSLALVAFYLVYLAIAHLLTLPRLRSFLHDHVDPDEHLKLPFALSRTAFGTCMSILGFIFLARALPTAPWATTYFQYDGAFVTFSTIAVAARINEALFFLKHGKQYPEDCGVAMVTAPMYVLMYFGYLFFPATGSYLSLVVHLGLGEMVAAATGFNYVGGILLPPMASMYYFTTSLAVRLAATVLRMVAVWGANVVFWLWLVRVELWRPALPAPLESGLYWNVALFGVGTIATNSLAFSEFRLAADLARGLVQRRDQTRTMREARARAQRRAQREGGGGGGGGGGGDEGGGGGGGGPAATMHAPETSPETKKGTKKEKKKDK